MEGFSLEDYQKSPLFDKMQNLVSDMVAHVIEEEIDELYSAAVDLLCNKCVEEARDGFLIVAFLRPFIPNNWISLAAAYQMLNEYEQALEFYMFAQNLLQDEKDAMVYVHMADCYFALGCHQEGLKALEAARLLAIAQRPKDEKVLEQVALMYKIWSNKG